MIKKIIVVCSSLLLLILGVLLVLPLFFKNDILKVVENQSSKYLGATLKIEDASLSLFKDFPNMNVDLRGVELTGKGEFSGDTIAQIAHFQLSINLKSLFVGKQMVVNNISLRDALLQPTVSVNGVNNWAVTKSENGDEGGEKDSNEADDFSYKLDDISTDNVKVIYKNLKNSNYLSVENVKFNLKGNLSSSNTSIDFVLALQNISYIRGNSILLNKCNLLWDSAVAADMVNHVYSVKRNNLSINDLKLDLSATVAMTGDDRYNVKFEMNAPDNKFESLLTLVPDDYSKYLKGVTTSGEFNFSVKVDGDYYENNLPKIDALFAVKNGKFKYDNQPEGIEDIDIELSMTNPGGSVDSTVIDLRSASFNIADNPFNMFVKVVNISNPYLTGGAIGTINFESLKKALPMDDVTISGVMTTDIAFDGEYQYIENEQYEKFNTHGNISFKDVHIVTASYPSGVSIESGNLQFTPSKLNLANLKAKIFTSDFAINGNITNYIPYILKDEVLKGNFTLTSNRINFNDFATTKNSAKDNVGGNVSGDINGSSSVIEIPRNIDFKFSANVANMVLGGVKITNTRGSVALVGGIATLSNLSMNMLEGVAVINGNYNPLNIKEPSLDFKLNVSNFDVKAMYDSFSMVKKALPMATDCQGKVSAQVNFTSKLDSTMSLNIKTLTGNGKLNSRGILINNSSLDMLAAYVKNDELNRVSISKLDINFKISSGNITIEPFTTMLAGNPLTMSGTQSVDGQLNYLLSMNIKREKFGTEILKMLSSVPGSKNVKALDFDIKIGGTLEKPLIKPDISKAISTVTKEAAKELLNSKGGILKGLGIF